MTVPPGRTRLVAVVATLLTVALPALALGQSPSPATSPIPPVPTSQAGASPLPSPAAPGASPSSAAPDASASAAASPSTSAAPTPLWTPPALSGPIALLTAGLPGDARAVSIADAFRATLTESCPQAVLDTHTADTAETQAEQARTALTGGAKVIVIDPVDPTAAASIVTEAQSGGASVIALGEAITGAAPDLQVAYDEPATGSLIGAVVVQVASDAAALDADDAATPLPSDVPVEQVVLIDGPDGDADLAAWVADVKDGLGARATVVHEAAITELTAAEGKRVVGEAIGALTTNGFGAVITPADAVAAGVIEGLREAGVAAGAISVTGLGGTLPGTQAIVAGDQLLTTWAPDAAAASVAATLACGQGTGVGVPAGLTTTPVDNGAGQVATVLLTGIVVTRDGSVEGTRSVESTIVAGRAYGPHTVASICVADLAQACDDLGLVIPSPSPVPSASTAPSASPAASAPVAASGSPAAVVSPEASPSA